MSTLTLRRGDSRVLDLTATTPDGEPYSLAGVSLAFTVKRGYDDADEDALIRKTSGGGIAVVGDNAAEITLSAADTTELRPGAPLVWDVQATKDGEVVTLASGSLRVLPDVTRLEGLDE